MGGPGSGRFPRGTTHAMTGGNPKGKYAAQRNPQPGDNPIKFSGDIGDFGVDQPKPSSAWNNIVQAWWRALGKSAISKIAQPADWMYAWIAADLLQYMYDTAGFQAGLMQNWVMMADKLHAPHFEQLELPDGAEEPVDEDDDEAEASISDIKDRFRVVK